MASLKTTNASAAYPQAVEDGFFYPSCYIHSVWGLERPALGGLNSYQALSAWMNGSSTRLQDTCPEGSPMCGDCPIWGK